MRLARYVCVEWSILKRAQTCTAIPHIVCMDVLNLVRLPQGWLAGWLPDTWLYFMPMSAVLIHLNLTHTHARAPNPWAQRWIHRASSSSSTAMHTSIERDFIRWHSILQIFANQHQYAHCTLAIIFCDLQRDDAMMHAALFGSLLLRTVHTHTHEPTHTELFVVFFLYIPLLTLPGSFSITLNDG